MHKGVPPTVQENRFMPITEAEQVLLDAVSLDAPWALVETFATMPRWRPEDVNRAVDVLVSRLRGLGLPVDVHEPEIFLSIPYSASVTAGGVTHRAKPPSSSLSVPGGRTGPLVALKANPKALRCGGPARKTLPPPAGPPGACRRQPSCGCGAPAQ